jgi:hypothetical protein
MPYREFIPEPVRQKVDSWNLRPSLARALWEAARRELRTRPEAGFNQSIAPVKCLILPLYVNDPETGRSCRFLFYVDVDVRPGERTVIDVRDLDQPIGTPLPPSGAAGPRPEFTDD